MSVLPSAVTAYYPTFTEEDLKKLAKSYPERANKKSKTEADYSETLKFRTIFQAAISDQNWQKEQPKLMRNLLRAAMRLTKDDRKLLRDLFMSRIYELPNDILKARYCQTLLEMIEKTPREDKDLPPEELYQVSVNHLVNRLLSDFTYCSDEAKKCALNWVPKITRLDAPILSNADIPKEIKDRIWDSLPKTLVSISLSGWQEEKLPSRLKQFEHLNEVDLSDALKIKDLSVLHGKPISKLILNGCKSLLKLQEFLTHRGINEIPERQKIQIITDKDTYNKLVSRWKLGII